MNAGALIFIVTLVYQMLPGNEATHQQPVLGTSAEQSCLDYYKKGIKRSGYYHVRNYRVGYTVYCDMESEPGSAWTLVESFALKHKKMPQFFKHPLKTNAPVLPNTPNWNRYRMSLPQMQHLKSQSTHWRVTCDFQSNPADLHQDYALARFKDFDALSFLGSPVCKKMVYINIRGHECAECTAPWYALIDTYALHVDSTAAKQCELKPSPGSVSSEDNFGVYSYTNNKFRCTSSADATTNFWFGGYF